MRNEAVTMDEIIASDGCERWRAAIDQIADFKMNWGPDRSIEGAIDTILDIPFDEGIIHAEGKLQGEHFKVETLWVSTPTDDYDLGFTHVLNDFVNFRFKSKADQVMKNLNPPPICKMIHDACGYKPPIPKWLEDLPGEDR